MHNDAAKIERQAVKSPSRLLSLRETMVLSGTTEREKDIRNDIAHGAFPETNVIRLSDTHLRFQWPHVWVFAAVYGNKLLRDPESRRSALQKVIWEWTDGSGHRPLAKFPNSIFGGNTGWYDFFSSCENLKVTIDIDSYLTIDIGKVCRDVNPRICAYAKGLGRIEKRDEILGGTAVFRGSRISVLHIGKMAERKGSVIEIMEDYDLTKTDVEFAELYYRARPLAGRRRGRQTSLI